MLKLIVSNIQFKLDPEGFKVPSDLAVVKSWINEYYSELVDISDEQAMDTYIRTALFHRTELTYDTEVTHDIDLVKYEWQPSSVDAFDAEHGSYKLVQLQLEHAESVVYCFTDDDVKCCYTSEDTEAALHDQLAFQYLMQYLPIKITVTDC
jgi:hypothetical protein